MSTQISLRQAREFISSQEGGVIAPVPVSEEELNPQLQDDLSYRARPLESKNQCYPVNYQFPADSMCSEFSFFEDGRQRTLTIGHITAEFGNRTVIIPVHYFVVAAVILQRTGGSLRLWREPLIRTGILLEKSLIKDQDKLSEFEQSGLTIIDTRRQANDPEEQAGNYADLRQRALRRVKDIRLSTETDLISQWRESDVAGDNFLVVDGTLMNFRNEDNVERCIGVSKSFGSRYFSSSDHSRILQMNEFERSWTFNFHADEEDIRLGGRERVSWYLRLRKRPNTEPEFGLIRVEISQRHLDRASELANGFSRSLLSERLPTAYPSPRWDKHLYPIQACENYLTSIMPSIGTITATMRG